MPHTANELTAADTVSTVLIALETAPANSLRLTALAVRRTDGERGIVSLRCAGQVHGLTIEQARLAADALAAEQPYPGWRAVARALNDAAEQAERQLGACRAAAMQGLGFRPTQELRA